MRVRMWALTGAVAIALALSDIHRLLGLAVVVALTALAAAEARCRTARTNLEELLVMKDRFIATVSHELRTPLAAILGFATHMQSAPDDLPRAERQELIGLIAAQGSEMSFLVDDLLVASRGDAGEPTMTPVRINALDELPDVVESCRVVSPEVDSSIAIEGDPAVVVWADPGRYRQVVRNLVTNALRYGGSQIVLQIAAEGDRAVLEVRDDGAAIDPSQRERIFEPYGRSDEQPGLAGSVGLGLFVARSLAERMSGSLTYDHDGSEAVFRLSLPAAAEQEKP